ncbi:MAG: hypothetical protein JO100_10650 [Pseudonocardia sp.]|nr:hypothetical protein [Pseudonocardia sp.]
MDYKNAKVKQYHKESRAPRTETTINDTRDFGLSKRLTEKNLTALRQIGFSAYRRLPGVHTISHDPIRGARAFTELTTPIITDEAPASPDCVSETPASTPYRGPAAGPAQRPRFCA